jgi:hypothetical protein
MIIHTYQKSKKRKPNAKQRELARDWEKLLKKYETKKPLKVSDSVKPFVPSKPFVRETPRYPSLNTFEGSCIKPIHSKVYTGTLIIGIGTMHKSNAVPILTDKEAKDQAAMRR